MELPQTAQQLLEIERRQDDLLRQLEQLDEELKVVLATCQRQLRIVQCPAAQDPS